MTGLYVDVTGRAAGEAVADVVLVHGWGLHGGVWEDVAQDLGGRYRVWRIDLPGHGHSELAPALSGAGYTLPALAEAVLETLAPRLAGPAWWVGWSLGGQVVLQLTLDFPDRVSGMATVASTPRFVAASDWSCAVAPSVLAGFADELGQDYRATLLRFLALQGRGGEHAREDVRRLREQVFARGEPDTRALHGGLEILKRTDLRRRLGDIAAPLLALGGERDVLVPPAAIVAMADDVHDGKAVIMHGAGHAPFISDRAGFVTQLKQFIDARL